MRRLIYILGFSLTLLASESPQELFRAALENIKRGNFTDAEAEIKEGLKANPRSPAGFDLLGITYDGEGRRSEAEKALRQAVALDPQFIPAHNDLGILLYRQGRVPDANGEFLSVLALDGHNFTANYNLGIIARDSKRYAAAVKHLQVAHSLAPSDPATAFALVAAYLGASRVHDADAVSSQLVALNPADAGISFSLGALFLESKSYESAAKYLGQARLLSPNNYEVLYDLGQAYTHLRRYVDAEGTFLKALTIRSDSVDTLFQLATAYAEDHHSDEAIQILARARQLSPRRPDLLLLLARECIQEGLWDDAEDLLTECIGLDKEKMEPHLLLGEAYTRARKYDKAVAEYEVIAKLDPKNPYALVSLGRSYEYLGRFTEAKAVLERALRMDSRNIAGVYYLGLIAEDQNDFHVAKARFEQVLRLDPASFGSLLELGNIYTEEKDYSRARNYYERAVKASPASPQTYYRLSVLFRRLKETDRANEMFALFQKYQRTAEDERKYHPHGVLTFLAQTQDLSESERLKRYKQELQHVAQIRPDDVNVLLMLAQVDLGLGERSEGLAQIDQIVGLAPNDSNVRIRIAKLLKAFQLHVQAADQLRPFLEQHETADDVRIALASLYGEMGRTSDAIALLKGRGGPDAPAAYHYLLGRFSIRQMNFPYALEELRRAAALAPDSVEYALYAGICAAELGQSAESARLIAAAKVKSPNSAVVLYADGIELLLNGRSKEAQSSFQRASDLLYNWEAPRLAQAYALSDSPRQKKMLLDETESMFQNSPWPHLLKSKLLNSEVELEKALRLAPADPRVYAQLLSFRSQQGNCDLAKEVCRRMLELGIRQDCTGPPVCVEQVSRARSSPKIDADILLLIDMLADSARPI